MGAGLSGAGDHLFDIYHHTSGFMAAEVHVITHPLVQHKLSLLRHVDTHTQDFRKLLKEVAMLLAYEVTRDLPLKYVPIQTPLTTMDAPMLAADKKMAIISIMRAGQGLLDGMLELIPTAKVGHIGLYRQPSSLMAVEYYFKLPTDIEQRDMLVVDPMLATGNSAVAAVDRLKEAGPLSIKFVCLLAAPEGIAHFHSEHPDVPIYTASVDDHLDAQGYILPGLGDAGDRLYGTR
ncbi:MAG TPA: uracil phosphoribosyltransferase [Candidatus Obscuribacterales bacterium]